MTNQQWLSLCNAGDVSDYGESLELLPDTVGRSLATRIRLLLARADRESRLAVRLRQELHDIAGSDVASAITVAERPQPQEARTLLCETCGHSHYFEVDEAGFDSAEVIPWGKCKTCDCEEPSYTDEPLGPPPQDAQE